MLRLVADVREHPRDRREAATNFDTLGDPVCVENAPDQPRSGTPVAPPRLPRGAIPSSIPRTLDLSRLPLRTAGVVLAIAHLVADARARVAKFSRSRNSALESAPRVPRRIPAACGCGEFSAIMAPRALGKDVGAAVAAVESHRDLPPPLSRAAACNPPEVQDEVSVRIFAVIRSPASLNREPFSGSILTLLFRLSIRAPAPVPVGTARRTVSSAISDGTRCAVPISSGAT